MLSAADYKFLEKLYSGNHIDAYRGERVSDKGKVILKTTKGDYPSDKDIAALHHEFHLLEKLHLPGIIRAESLFEQQHRWILVLEDIAGKPLQEFLNGKPLELKEFFRIALQLVDIIGSLHQHHIIHKDIKPSNIIIEPTTLTIKLADLSISSQLSEESQEYMHPTILEGSLPYLSPEQTGRLNRPIDYRSDFYSLGITFFEVLTGQLPFQAQDPMELVHAHLAKFPPRVSSINSKIPDMISAIIAKLLAKMPEDRYDSAIGLKADLAECARQWDKHRYIEPFELGQQDIHDHLHISQKLYGREEEIETLLAAFDRVSLGTNELFLVSGYAGIGKTSLVREVHKPITSRHGYFIQGKFDQLQRNQPYSAIISVFQTLVKQILVEPEEALSRIRTDLNQALGHVGQVIIDVIPEMELIIGPQSSVPTLNPSETQNRFHMAFQALIRAFARAEHPLVIFLDDLQWIDSPSLTLLEVLLLDTTSRYILIIGSYRDNEATAGHPLLITIQALQKAKVKIEQIKLNPLNENDVKQLVMDTFSCSERQVQSFVNLLLEKTQGNPFFINEFLRTLYQEHLITFSYSDSHWQWDLDKINQQKITNNVVDLLIAKIQKLTPAAQALLPLAACIGHTFNLDTLHTISEQSKSQTAQQLWEAAEANLIRPIGEDYKMVSLSSAENAHIAYQFIHDRVQQAAYQLIPIETRQQIHLKIGRLLLKNEGNTKDFAKNEQALFQILEHLNQSISLITNASEQHHLAQLNFAATLKAKTAIAYQAAISYATAGVALLASSGWETDHDLMYSLTKEKAEIIYLLGRHEEAEKQFDELLQIAHTNIEKAEIYCVKMILYSNKNQYEQCIQTGLAALSLFDIHLPLEPKPHHILKQVAIITARTAFKSIANLDKILPETSDPEQLVISRLIFEMMAATFFSRPPLFVLMLCKGVAQSLQHGYSPYSISIYGGYATLLLQLKRWDTASAFLALANKLAEKENNPLYAGKLRTPIALFFNHWRYPLIECGDFVRKNYQLLLESGDLIFAVYMQCIYLPILHLREIPLNEFQKESDTSLEIFKKNKDEGWYDLFLYHKQNHIFYLQEKGKLNLEQLPELVNKKQASSATKSCFFMFTTEMFFLQRDYGKALEAAETADTYKVMEQGFVLNQDLYFFYALTLLKCIDATTFRSQKQSYWRTFRKIERKLTTWVEICPVNIKHKYLLVKAEKARLLGNFKDAVTLYDDAIAAAQEQNFFRTEALANEFAGEFYLAQQNTKFAKWYFREAQYAYQRWGATAKVKDLMRRYPQWLQQQVSDISVSSLPGDITTTTANTQSLDFFSILKVSQAISSEIHIDKLLQKLLAIIMENGGAQRGIIVVNHGRRWFVEAEMQANNTEVLLPRVSLESYENLPASLLMYVQRTKKSFISSDTEHTIHLMDDPYIARVKPKSMLCVPIIQQGQVKTIVYLENSATSNAFTAQNLEMLQLLSAQIAISLENAYLYAASNRFSPKEFLQQLGRTSLVDVQLGDQIQKKLSVMFCDIRSFTALSEKMTPSQNFEFINTFLGHMEPIIRDHHGFIDKYIGDAIMALYTETTDNAIASAIEMLKILAKFNKVRARAKLSTIKVGIGINTGDLMLGVIGTSHRTESSVIGDTVNIASRIEDLTKRYDVPLLVGGDTVAGLQNPSKFMLRLIDEIILRGKSKPTEIWEIYNIDEEFVRQMKHDTRALFEEARQLYKKRQYKEAHEQFSAILQQNPSDNAAQFYRDFCKQHM